MNNSWNLTIHILMVTPENTFLLFGFPTHVYTQIDYITHGVFFFMFENTFKTLFNHTPFSISLILP